MSSRTASHFPPPTIAVRRRWINALSVALAILFFAVAVPPVLAAADDKDKPAADDRFAPLADYIEQARQAWEVPGVSIAIVEDDEVVFTRGFGVRQLGSEAAVDPQTQFAIGSASKAFTAAAIGMLVDEGKLGWDDRAAERLPGFELFDPYVTRELTVRDLLCHRSGLPRGDQLWYGSNYDRKEVIRRVRYLEPEWSLRSHFGYQNIMYLAAGEVVEAVSGKSWDDFIRERIFAPLAMKTSSTSVTALADRDNVASPHGEVDGTLTTIAWRNIDNIAPAGSINSNAAEMAQWVRLQLGRGQLDGQRLIAEATLDEMHSPQMFVKSESPIKIEHLDGNFSAYGLGWSLRDYRGLKIVEHGGAIDGMRSHVLLVPEKKVGVVILCNRNGTALPVPLAMRAIDTLLDLPETDWSAKLLEQVKKLEGQAKAAEVVRKAAHKTDTHPSLALDKYAGTYESKIYGPATVRCEGDKLVVERSPAFIGDATHWHFDTFEVRWRDRFLGETLVTFQLNDAGAVVALDVPRLGTFERPADPQPTDEAEEKAEEKEKQKVDEPAADKAADTQAATKDGS